MTTAAHVAINNANNIKANIILYTRKMLSIKI